MSDDPLRALAREAGIAVEWTAASGDWCNGNIAVSKTAARGSIPRSPAAGGASSPSDIIGWVAPTIPDEVAYAHLLGLYLGDGCIWRAPRTVQLQVSFDARHPGLADECRDSMAAVSPDARIAVRRRRDAACLVVSSYWRGGVRRRQAGLPAGRNACSVRRSRVVLAPRPWRQAGGKAHSATVAKKAAHRGEHV